MKTREPIIIEANKTYNVKVPINSREADVVIRNFTGRKAKFKFSCNVTGEKGAVTIELENEQRTFPLTIGRPKSRGDEWLFTTKNLSGYNIALMYEFYYN